MARAAAKEAKTDIPDASAFGQSPHPFADTIRKEAEERERRRKEELRKQRQMTNPHHGSENPNRPDLLAVPKEYQDELANKGLMAGWINKINEWPEYEAIGAKPASHADIARCTGRETGQLRHDSSKDAASSPTDAVERREMMLVIFPKKWHDDRLLQEQHLARSQMGDPFAPLKGANIKGHFGKGAQRPDALVFGDDKEDDA